MEHGKDHGAHHAATQHSKKGHEQTDSKHQQHQTDESQAPRTGFQASTGYGANKASELSSFSNQKDFEDLDADSHSNSTRAHEEHAEDDDDKDDHHGKK